MKNYLKFIVAVFGITVATFGTAQVRAGNGRTVTIGGGENVTCKGSGDCGYTPDCQVITGTPTTSK